MRIPGEYLGSERQLPQDVFPEARMVTSARLRGYLRDIETNLTAEEKNGCRKAAITPKAGKATHRARGEASPG